MFHRNAQKLDSILIRSGLFLNDGIAAYAIMDKKIITLAALSSVSLPSFGALVVLPDSDFEGTAWSTFGNAFQDEVAPGIDAGLEGTQTLKMFGNFSGGTNFSGVFQDLDVDGASITVGDEVTLSGKMMHLSGDPLGSSGNNAFFEITFIAVGGSEFGFGGIVSPNLASTSATDTWLDYSTNTGVVPAGADKIRLKVTFRQDAGAGGASWTDQLTLDATTVPEPSSALLVGLSALGFVRRRR